MTSIISYNVNGIRAAIGKGFYEWLGAENPDIICLQEIKALRQDVPVEALEALGYHHCWNSAEKKGYSGTATFSKIPPKQVIIGCGIPEYDREGRVLITEFENFTLLNCYFPSGTSGDDRQDFKMKFLADFDTWIQVFKQIHPNLIIVGDYNIAHQEIDLHDPKGNKKTSGFLPEEREWMTHWFKNGFTDAFRHSNPEKQKYSWWTFRFNSRAKDKGWRIDYQSISTHLSDKIVRADMLYDAVHSDHCPVQVTYTL